MGCMTLKLREPNDVRTNGAERRLVLESLRERVEWQACKDEPVGKNEEYGKPCLLFWSRCMFNRKPVELLEEESTWTAGLRRTGEQLFNCIPQVAPTYIAITSFIVWPITRVCRRSVQPFLQGCRSCLGRPCNSTLAASTTTSRLQGGRHGISCICCIVSRHHTWMILFVVSPTCPVVADLARHHHINCLFQHSGSQPLVNAHFQSLHRSSATHCHLTSNHPRLCSSSVNVLKYFFFVNLFL